MPKNKYVEINNDSRYLNTVTDLIKFFWPPEPVHMKMTRVNCKFSSVCDLFCAYHQVPLSSETQKRAVLSIMEHNYPTRVVSKAYVDFGSSPAE